MMYSEDPIFNLIKIVESIEKPGEKSFQCSICKVNLNINNLTEHIENIHTDNKQLLKDDHIKNENDELRFTAEITKSLEILKDFPQHYMPNVEKDAPGF